MKQTYVFPIERGCLEVWSLPFPDGDYQVTIATTRRLRSSNQLKYLWGVVYRMIAQETGNTLEDIHSALKLMFLKDVMVMGGKEVFYVKSLSDRGDTDTAEMHEYIEQVRAWAATELEISIPDPT
jgi:hypothetical protein